MAPDELPCPHCGNPFDVAALMEATGRAILEGAAALAYCQGCQRFGWYDTEAGAVVPLPADLELDIRFRFSRGVAELERIDNPPSDVGVLYPDDRPAEPGG